MPARKPKTEQITVTVDDVDHEFEVTLNEVPDRGPGPDQAETRASRWDTPRST